MKVVFENKQFLVVDKPSGLVVNKSETVNEETMQDWIQDYLNLAVGDLGIGGRAGIVHRLDRETSGLLVIAKTQRFFDFLQNEFKERRVEKEYIALVHGSISENEGLISGALGRIGKFGKFGVVDNGREAVTEFVVEGRYELSEDWVKETLQNGNITETRPRLIYLKSNARFYTQLLLKPKTGRTHQIRVHLKSINHPVVSDLIYTPAKLIKFDLLWCPRLFLHSSKLAFKLSPAGKILEFKSDLPNDIKNVILSLEKIRV